MCRAGTFSLPVTSIRRTRARVPGCACTVTRGEVGGAVDPGDRPRGGERIAVGPEPPHGAVRQRPALLLAGAVGGLLLSPDEPVPALLEALRQLERPLLGLEGEGVDLERGALA